MYRTALHCVFNFQHTADIQFVHSVLCTAASSATAGRHYAKPSSAIICLSSSTLHASRSRSVWQHGARAADVLGCVVLSAVSCAQRRDVCVLQQHKNITTTAQFGYDMACHERQCGSVSIYAMLARCCCAVQDGFVPPARHRINTRCCHGMIMSQCGHHNTLGRPPSNGMAAISSCATQQLDVFEQQQGCEMLLSNKRGEHHCLPPFCCDLCGGIGLCTVSDKTAYFAVVASCSWLLVSRSHVQLPLHAAKSKLHQWVPVSLHVAAFVHSCQQSDRSMRS